MPRMSNFLKLFCILMACIGHVGCRKQHLENSVTTQRAPGQIRLSVPMETQGNKSYFNQAIHEAGEQWKDWVANVGESEPVARARPLVVVSLLLLHMHERGEGGGQDEVEEGISIIKQGLYNYRRQEAYERYLLRGPSQTD